MIDFFKNKSIKSNFNSNIEEFNSSIEDNNLENEELKFKVISDGIITLYSNYNIYSELSNGKTIFFNIYLNEYDELIGDISFYFNKNNYIDYTGNITYNIEDKYKNNHYATRALRLIKELLNNFKYEGNKDIYISTRTYDIPAQKVAKNNDAFLFYEGKVPEDESLCYLNGVKYVKIYRIKI